MQTNTSTSIPSPLCPVNLWSVHLISNICFSFVPHFFLMHLSQILTGTILPPLLAVNLWFIYKFSKIHCEDQIFVCTLCTAQRKCDLRSSISQWQVHANPQMKNTTNMLILNLAVADLLFILICVLLLIFILILIKVADLLFILICVPFTASDYVLMYWPFGLFWYFTILIFTYI